MTTALLGFGTLFKIRTSTGPDVYTVIGEQAEVSKPYAVSVDSIDATHEQSPGANKEFIPGLIDNGSVEMKLHYIPGGTTEAQLLGFVGVVQLCRVTFPSGAYVQYSAFITDVGPASPIDGKMTSDVKLKITGQITPNAAAAPINALLPSIAASDGVINVGDTLTAIEGVWTREPTSYTYQWKKAGTNIAGATARTYVPVVGDIGGAITVAVTAVNSAGSATATSIATINVAA
jgi:predicted secreted protein